MKFQVEMQAFQGGLIREVDVPDDLAHSSYEIVLDAVFEWGQNERQNVPGRCSVSVGDVIRCGSKRFRVASTGFEELKEGENPAGRGLMNLLGAVILGLLFATSAFAGGRCPDAGKGKTKNGVYQPTKCEKKELNATKGIRRLREEFPGISDAEIGQILRHEIWVGMTIDEFNEATPNARAVAVNDMMTADGLETQAVYDRFTDTLYVYFKNGVLTAWQKVDHPFSIY